MLNTFDDRAFDRQSDATVVYLDASGAARKNSRRQTWNCSIFITPKTSRAANRRSRGTIAAERVQLAIAHSAWLLDCIRMRLARQEHSGEERS